MQSDERVFALLEACGQSLQMLAPFGEHDRPAAHGGELQRVPGDHLSACLVGRERREDLLDVRVGRQRRRVKGRVPSHHTLGEPPR